MAGVNVDGGAKGRRRSLDSDINMIPMIDLLMVTISFLLITAVWTHMARIDANAMVPGPNSVEPPPPSHPEKQLHVMMQAEDKFVLAWKEGNTVVDSIEVPRSPTVVHAGPMEVVRFDELASRIASEWKAKGQHTSDTDHAVDQAVLHTDDHTEFRYVIAVIDAIYGTRRPMIVGAKHEDVPAFNVTFATGS
jgi:biopolymer transport protein ExbD